MYVFTQFMIPFYPSSYNRNTFITFSSPYFFLARSLTITFFLGFIYINPIVCIFGILRPTLLLQQQLLAVDEPLSATSTPTFPIVTSTVGLAVDGINPLLLLSGEIVVRYLPMGYCCLTHSLVPEKRTSI